MPRKACFFPQDTTTSPKTFFVIYMNPVIMSSLKCVSTQVNYTITASNNTQLQMLQQMKTKMKTMYMKTTNVGGWSWRLQ